jgi:hypothetical protein
VFDLFLHSNNANIATSPLSMCVRSVHQMLIPVSFLITCLAVLLAEFLLINYHDTTDEVLAILHCCI